MNKNTYLLLVLMSCSVLSAQNNFKYWQQHVDYKMDVTVDVTSNTYSGTQKLIYTNNSPEALNVVFYHLYYNAFQPGSEMDIREKEARDVIKSRSSLVLARRVSKFLFRKYANR